jgi:hypothetical protein
MPSKKKSSGVSKPTRSSKKKTTTPSAHAPKKKTTTPSAHAPKKKTTKNSNSQAKLRYINSCISTMIGDMPRQTFSNIFPVVFICSTDHIVPNHEVQPPRSSNPKRKRTSTPAIIPSPTVVMDTQVMDTQVMDTQVVAKRSKTVILQECFLPNIPSHPNIQIQCAFCHKEISLETGSHPYIEQPHTRRRFTPICQLCSTIT